VRDDEEGVFEEFALDVSVFAEHDAIFSRARRRRRRRRLLRRPPRRRPRGLRRGDERLRREVRERNRRAVEEVAQGLVLLRARGVERELLTPRRRGLLFFASRSVSARSTNLRARSHARGTQRGRERERHDRRDALADEDEEEEERDGCRRVRALARSARRGRGKAKYLAVRFAKSAWTCQHEIRFSREKSCYYPRKCQRTTTSHGRALRSQTRAQNSRHEPPQRSPRQTPRQGRPSSQRPPRPLRPRVRRRDESDALFSQTS